MLVNTPYTSFATDYTVQAEKSQVLEQLLCHINTVLPAEATGTELVPKMFMQKNPELIL